MANQNNTTAVDWLIENLPDMSNYIPLGLSLELHAKFEQARQIEREQIEQSYNQADINGMGKSYGHGKLYYNETYGKSE